MNERLRLPPGLTLPWPSADGRQMAKQRPRDSDGGAEEEKSLSVRMRELIESAKVEECRTSDGQPSKPVDERRRRNDKSKKPEDSAA